MDDKELAEKVFERLSKNRVWFCGCGHYGENLLKNDAIFLPMVRCAQSMGWLLEMEGKPCCQGPEEYTLYFANPPST